MKTFKKALLGLALATCAAVNAYAVPLTDTVLVFPDLSGDGTLISYAFGEGDASVNAGDTFSYDFLFQPGPAVPTTSFAFYLIPDTLYTVAFSSLDFAYYDGTAVDFTLFNNGYAAGGSGWLDSGLYDLHVTGTYLADAAGITGAAVDDITQVSLPEPMSMALMGLGLVGLAGARRRKAVPAAAAA